MNLCEETDNNLPVTHHRWVMPCRFPRDFRVRSFYSQNQTMSVGSLTASEFFMNDSGFRREAGPGELCEDLTHRQPFVVSVPGP